MEIREITFSFLCYPWYWLASHRNCNLCILNVYLCVCSTSLCAVLFNLLICDTEINQSINQIIMKQYELLYGF